MLSKHLAKAIAVLTGRKVKADSSVELANDIAGSIMEVAEREHVDFVVISTHGHIRLASTRVWIDCREGH
jgi:nucleotide-binding universal stress UspA family protein